MKNERLLPTIRIHDTAFFTDLEKLEFRQVDNPSNVIPFNKVHDHGSHTSLTFDPVTRNVFTGTVEELGKRPDVVRIELPPAIELDTQYIADTLLKLHREKVKQDKGADTGKIDEVKKRKKGRGI